jgi:hypothetical protein
LRIEGKTMGSWGAGPYENDAAADWFNSLLKPKARERLDRKLSETLLTEPGVPEGDRTAVGEFRAACHLLAALGDPFSWPGEKIPGDELWSRAISGLRALQADEAWLATWTDPSGIRGSLRREIAALVPRDRDAESASLEEFLSCDHEWTRAKIGHDCAKCGGRRVLTQG